MGECSLDLTSLNKDIIIIIIIIILIIIIITIDLLVTCKGDKWIYWSRVSEGCDARCSGGWIDYGNC